MLVVALHTPPYFVLFGSPILKPEISLDFVVDKLAEAQYKFDGLACRYPYAEVCYSFNDDLILKSYIFLLKVTAFSNKMG